MTKRYLTGVLAVLCAGTVSCTQEADQYGPTFGGESGELLGQARGTTSAVQYAPGPYGVGVGSVINNYSFLGFPQPGEDDDGLETIRMGDFYNPTGEGVYPADSLYRPGEALPKALMIANSAGWCYPCMVEAIGVIDPRYDDDLETGGEYLLSLEEGLEGNDANEDDLWDWVNATNFPSALGVPSGWRVRWPSFINPHGTLWPIIGQGAFPGVIIVRTRDMKIVYVQVGAGGSLVFDTFDAVVDDQPVLPGD